MPSSEMKIQRARWQLAALQVRLKLLRLGLALRAYNPGQFRVLKGDPMASVDGCGPQRGGSL